MVNYTIKNSKPSHYPPNGYYYNSKHYRSVKTSSEDRKKRIDKHYDEYVESYREVYENNPSYYASPEAFRKHMPLTRENFVWLWGGEHAWGPVYTEEEQEMRERFFMWNELGDKENKPRDTLPPTEHLGDYGTVEDSPDGGKVFVWNSRDEAIKAVEEGYFDNVYDMFHGSVKLGDGGEVDE